MNRGGLGWLENTGRMQIPVDLLDHLGVLPGQKLHGVYYPPEHSNAEEGVATVDYDFVLTPVPFRQWSRCAFMVLRINHQPGALRKIADLLDRESVSVVIAEATRSGYRFATWNTHVVLEAADPGAFDSSASVYAGTRAAVADLKRKLEEECADVLFREPGGVDLDGPIEMFAQTALAYFHNNAISHGGDSAEGSWRYQPFEVACAEDGILFSDRGGMNAILKSGLSMQDGTIAATRVIAALDTRLANIRLSVLPSDRLNRFAEVKVGYSRHGPPDTTSGVMSGLTARLSRDFNIWRTYTDIGPSEPNYESGSSFFLVEDVSADKYSSWDDLWRKLSDLLKPGDRIKKVPEIRLDEPIIHPLQYGYKVPRSSQSRTRLVPYKVFVSYGHGDKEVADDLVARLEQEAVAVLWDGTAKSGQVFAELIRQAILSADEVCILCSKKSLQSVWVTTEWGAAWALGKFIVPILIDVDSNELPNRLGAQLALKRDELPRYVKDVVARRELPRSRAHG